MLQCFVTHYDTDHFYANINTFGDVVLSKVDIIICYKLKKYFGGDRIIDILHFSKILVNITL